MDTSKPPETHVEPPETRVEYWQRVLARGVGKNPPVKVRLAIKAAATWSAEAVRLMSDRSATTNAKVRAELTARRLRADLKALIAEARPAPVEQSLQDYVRSRQVSA